MWLRVLPAGLLAVALMWASRAAAVTTSAYGGWLLRVWQTDDGLPQNSVTAITQTHDGYLWLGTFAGLARFDGRHFHVFDAITTPELGDERITALSEDREHRLWIGHESGQVSRYAGGVFSVVLPKPAHPAPIHGFYEDEHRAVWCLRNDGVFARIEPRAPDADAGGDGRMRVLSAAQSASGKIWVSVQGNAAELDGDRLRPLEFGRARLSGYVRGIGAARDGGFWIVRDGRVREFVQGQITAERGPWGSGDVTNLIELHDGTVAIGTMEGGTELRSPDGRVVTLDYEHGGIQNWVRSLYEDREGNLWISGGSGGLAMARRTAFAVLNSPDNWQGRTVLSVASAADGVLWIGTEGAAVYRYASGTWTHFDAAAGVTGAYIWALAVDANEQVWVGTWDRGMFRREGERFLPVGPLSAGTTPVLALHVEPADRSLWVGTGNGLLQWRDGQAVWRRSREHPNASISGIAADAKGSLWLALQEAGLGRLNGDEIETVDPSHRLASESVQCLRADGDTLWIGTQRGGLHRLKDGRDVAFESAMHVPSRVICHIEDDGHGYLWLSTHHGIVRVAKSELNRYAEGQTTEIPSETFDKNDGLPTLEYSGGMEAGGCRTADGRLWFTSNKGLVSVDPSALPLNTVAPPVKIEAMRVDGQPTALEHSVPRLPPGHERIEFEYTALSLSASSKIQFKYRLEGLDNRWINADDKRIATYSHLPAGDYRFHVIASNNDGVWNRVGDQVAFVVVPHVWETWWFRAFATMGAALIIGTIVRQETRRRMQRRLDELEHERGIERERARIAQDIHDDIGSTLTSISMLSQPVGSQAAAPEQFGALLGRIHQATLEVTHTLDEIVWAVNPRHDSLDSLVCYIARFAQERLSEAGIACRTDLPLDVPARRIGANVRHNVLLAFKEVLNNILKHSRATEVRVRLALQDDGFLLSVLDNGLAATPGAEPAAAQRPLGGNGLANLRNRLAQIGGSCEVRVVAGEGWQVDFVVKHLNSGAPERNATSLPNDF